jgi:hypothetical protein
MKMTLFVNPEGASDIQIDAIYIAPAGASPKGAFPPEILGAGG